MKTSPESPVGKSGSKGSRGRREASLSFHSVWVETPRLRRRGKAVGEEEDEFWGEPHQNFVVVVGEGFVPEPTSPVEP